MNNWEKVKLGEVCEVKGGKRLPKNNTLVSNKTPHPYIRIKDISTKKIELNDCFQYVAEDTFKTISRYIVKTNDVIISIVGTIGEIAIIGESLNNASLTENCVKLVDLISIDKDFLYYFLISDKGKDEIKKGIVGAVQPKLPIKNILQFEINLPPLDEQKRIADVLSALDDKIEVNNKINENLEAQAQAIFKRWFVDFEFPDKEGKPYKTNGGKFIDSELGEIPLGWKIGTLTQIASYLNGLAMQKFIPEEDEKGFPVLKIKELRQGCCDSSSDLCSERINSNYIINNGDIIFSWSGTLMIDFWTGGICGLNQHLFKVKSKKYEDWFVFLWTKHHLEDFIRIAKDKAVTMGHIKREHLDKAMILIPTDEIYNNLTKILKPIFSSIINLRIENKNLSEIRDSLLPKLMIGDIIV